jgi:hypothetical protein
MRFFVPCAPFLVSWIRPEGRTRQAISRFAQLKPDAAAAVSGRMVSTSEEPAVAVAE